MGYGGGYGLVAVGFYLGGGDFLVDFVEAVGHSGQELVYGLLDFVVVAVHPVQGEFQAGPVEFAADETGDTLFPFG